VIQIIYGKDLFFESVILYTKPSCAVCFITYKIIYKGLRVLFRMMGYVRLAYISKFCRNDDSFKLDLMDILTTSVNHNAQHGITGMLCYGNGCFIQCLEGKKSAVCDLYFKKILKDHRHTSCQLIYFEESAVQLFDQWAMKFAPLNPNLRNFFLENHQNEFDPYLLNSITIGPFIKLLSTQQGWEYYI